MTLTKLLNIYLKSSALRLGLFDCGCASESIIIRLFSYTIIRKLGVEVKYGTRLNDKEVTLCPNFNPKSPCRQESYTNKSDADSKEKSLSFSLSLPLGNSRTRAHTHIRYLMSFRIKMVLFQ